MNVAEEVLLIFNEAARLKVQALKIYPEIAAAVRSETYLSNSPYVLSCLKNEDHLMLFIFL